MGIEKRRYKTGRTTYYARLRWQGKKYRSRACPSRELAELEQGKMREAWRCGDLEREYGAGARDRPKTFADAAPDYLNAVARENAASTVRRKAGIIKQGIGF